MGYIGGHLPELIIVLVVILIIWGPGKLPDIGAGIGKGIREFRKASSETMTRSMGTTTTSGCSRLRSFRPSPHLPRHLCSAAGRARRGSGRRVDTPALRFWLTRPRGAC